MPRLETEVKVTEGSTEGEVVEENA